MNWELKSFLLFCFSERSKINAYACQSNRRQIYELAARSSAASACHSNDCHIALLFPPSPLSAFALCAWHHQSPPNPNPNRGGMNLADKVWARPGPELEPFKNRQLCGQRESGFTGGQPMQQQVNKHQWCSVQHLHFALCKYVRKINSNSAGTQKIFLEEKRLLLNTCVNQRTDPPPLPSSSISSSSSFSC